MNSEQKSTIGDGIPGSKPSRFLPPAGKAKVAVGLFVDGLHLKYVELSLTAGRVTLREFKTVSLAQKLEQRTTTLKDSEALLASVATEDDFGAPMEKARDGSPNAPVLAGLLNNISAPEYTVSFALSEPAVAYREFESNFGLDGLKLKKRLVAELSAISAEPPALDCLAAIPTASGGVLSIVRQGGLQLHELLNEIKFSLDRAVPPVKIIHSADVALMELVRSSYELSEEEVVVLIYMGSDFSRLIFMRGMNFLHFAPTISEGFAAANIHDTICSRMRLEQDNIGFNKIDRALLAGECHKTAILEAVMHQFPNTQVEYVKAPDLNVSLDAGTGDQVISEYAIPLAVAWRALQPKRHGAYTINLIPNSIAELQTSLTFAWHGWAAAGLILLSLLYFSLTIIPQASEIRAGYKGLSEKAADLAELEMYKAQKDTLESSIKTNGKAMETYKSIANGSGRWTRILDFLGNHVKNLNSVWIQSIRPVDGNPSAFDVGGRAYARSRISSLVNVFEKASLLQLKTVVLGKREVYEFDIRVEKIDKDDVPYVPSRSSKR